VPSPVVDDYLKSIYHHTEWQDRHITPKQLASVLGLAPSSVTEMVQKLAAQGLVSHQPYQPISLTPEGEHDEAEILEHALSDRLLEGIDRRLGHPRFDPHGDAIPDAAGHVERVPFVLLADAPAGHTGRVLRVSDRDPQVLRTLEDAGLTVGAQVRVDAPAAVTVAGRAVPMTDAAASAVWLSV
jgi:DtxR family Mn-dependent transcriptional regulator